MYFHPLAEPSKFVPPPVGTGRPPGASSGETISVLFVRPSPTPAQVAPGSGCFFGFDLAFFSDSIRLLLDTGERFNFPNSDQGLINALRTAAWAQEEGRAVA